jgi:hypothetical protein
VPVDFEIRLLREREKIKGSWENSEKDGSSGLTSAVLSYEVSELQN